MPKNPAAKEEYSKEKKLHNLGYRLSESQCRYAMANTTSNAEAAKWLHISYETWSKYAKSYLDETTGVTLFELHRQGGPFNPLRGRKKYITTNRKVDSRFKAIPLDDIFAGKHPKYSSKSLKDRLIREGLKVERCERCGYQERRASDWIAPIKLHWKDGNELNKSLDNIEFICWNCAFLLGYWVGQPRKNWKINEKTGEVDPIHPLRAVPTAEERRSFVHDDFCSLVPADVEDLTAVTVDTR